MGAPGRGEPGGGTAGSGAAAGPRAHRSGGGRFPPHGAALGELSPAAAAAESCDSEAGFARALPAPPAAPADSWHTPGTGGPRPPSRTGGAARGRCAAGGAWRGRPQLPAAVRRGRERRAVLPAAASGKSCPGDVSHGVARRPRRAGCSVTGGREVAARSAPVPAAPEPAQPEPEAPSQTLAEPSRPMSCGTKLPLEGSAILLPLKRVKDFFPTNPFARKKNSKYLRRAGKPAAVT